MAVHRIVHLLDLVAEMRHMERLPHPDCGPRSAADGGVVPARVYPLSPATCNFVEVHETHTALAGYDIERRLTGEAMFFRLGTAKVNGEHCVVVDARRADGSTRSYYIRASDLIHQIVHLSGDEPPCAGDWRLENR